MKLPSVHLLSANLLLAAMCLGQNTESKTSAFSPNDASREKLVVAVPQVSGPEYVIGNDDVLNVSVWKEPDISRTVPVRPDGKITLPLIGDIQASGLTTGKLQENLTNGLRSYVSNPAVTVIVQEVKSKNFNIVGEISKPGSYPLSEPLTILDAIAIGGGLRDFAKTGRIYVLRANNDGTHSKLAFDYKQVIKGKKLTQNVQLVPGDTVVIP